MGFLKWVTTILTTTQVTQNVILLALLFIYRLKNFNPGVSGKKGSEYRLLTIALMLGNKCESESRFQLEGTLADSRSPGRQYLHQQNLGRSIWHLGIRDPHYGGGILEQYEVQSVCVRGRVEEVAC